MELIYFAALAVLGGILAVVAASLLAAVVIVTAYAIRVLVQRRNRKLARHQRWGR